MNIHMCVHIYIYIYRQSSPSHRRVTPKGVPTVKSPKKHFEVTYK